MVPYSIHTPRARTVFILFTYGEQMRKKDLQGFLVSVEKYLSERGNCTLCAIILRSYHKHPVPSGGYVKIYVVKVLALRIR